MVPDGLAVEVRDLVKTYRTQTSEVRALNGVSADIPAGGVTAIVGPSGSGKSSLLRIVAGLDRATNGVVKVGSVDVTRLSARALRRVLRNMVGYVFQSPADNFVSYLSVAEHLELAGRPHNTSPSDALSVLARLALDHRADHLPHELSGGEQQRAAFAQILVTGASLIVADEPTAELDDESARLLLDVVASLSDEGVTFALATHDPHVVAVARHCVELAHGRLAGSDTQGLDR